jgi:hypothetical protein
VNHHCSSYNITNRTTFNPKVHLDQHSFNRNSAAEPAKAARQTTSLEIEVDVKEYITHILDIISSLLVVLNLRHLPKGLVRSESKQHLAHDGAAGFVVRGLGGPRRGRSHAHKISDMAAYCRAVTLCFPLGNDKKQR